MHRAAIALLLPADGVRWWGSGGAEPVGDTSARRQAKQTWVGYELSYECEGEGEPTVILEAGLGAAGTDEFFGFIDQVAESSRVCTYDRAGTGVSDDRPEGEHVTAGLMADELHRLLEVLGEEDACRAGRSLLRRDAGRGRSRGRTRTTSRAWC